MILSGLNERMLKFYQS